MPTLIEILIAVGIGILIVFAVLDYINSTAKKSPITVDSFRVAGLALCVEIHTSPALENCIAQVQAEWSAATAGQRGFDISNVPSIPAGRWP